MNVGQGRCWPVLMPSLTYWASFATAGSYAVREPATALGQVFESRVVFFAITATEVKGRRCGKRGVCGVVRAWHQWLRIDKYVVLVEADGAGRRVDAGKWSDLGGERNDLSIDGRIIRGGEIDGRWHGTENAPVL